MHDGMLTLLQETLESHGLACTRQAALEGRSGTVYTVPLLAEQDGKAFIVDVHLESTPLPEAAVQDMADVMHDTGADGGVMCHIGVAEAGADDEGVVLWGHDELVRMVGSARLAVATGTQADPPRFEEQRRNDGAIAQTVEDLLPPAFHDSPDRPMPPDALEAAAGEAETPSTPDDGTASAADELLGALGGIDLGALEDDGATQPPPPAADAGPDIAPTSSEGPATSQPDSPAAPQADNPAPPTADTVTGGRAFTYPLLPVRVLPDEARMGVKDQVYHVDRIDMLLQPVHLLDYECDLLAEGSLRYDTISGRVQVDGTDKEPTEVDPEALDPAGFTRLDEVPAMEVSERTLRTSPERAKEIAALFLTDAHTRLVDIEMEDEENGYSYTEKKRVAPRPDHVRLNPRGTFHRVIWRIAGPNGHMDVDALTGNVVEQVLQRPNPDAVMLD